MAEQTETGKRLIHLLYVPTVFCNLACSYCYLGDQTQPDTTEPDTSEIDTKSAVSTLKYALNYFQNENIIPFNVSLHGGEVTTLPKRVLSELFDCIRQHYLKNFDVFTANGFKKDAPHIKTNLFNFHKLTGLMEENGVSVSGSVDLPLSLHDKYRTTAGGGSTLRQTLENLTLLGTYGVEDAWKDRRNSKNHLGIPLVSAEFVQSVAMLCQMLQQLGFKLEQVCDWDATIKTEAKGALSGIFYVEDAHTARTAMNSSGQKVISASDFVNAYRVQTVFGGGGAYLTGTFIVFVLFTREHLPKAVAQRFIPLVNYFKAATMSLVSQGKIFV